MCPGLLNDLYQFDPSNLVWEELAAQVEGNPPVVRYGHRLSVMGNFLCLFGGIGNTSEIFLWFH